MRKGWIAALTVCAATICAVPSGAQDLGGGTWLVSDLNGQPFDVPATIEIGPDARIGGQGPCNSWFVRGTGRDGALFGLIGSTKVACDQLPDEIRFLAALRDVTGATVGPDGATLTLTGPMTTMVLRRLDQTD